MSTARFVTAVVLCTVVGGIAAIASVGQAATAVEPTNTAEPQISGSALVGRTLTATRGSWANSPTSFAFQWVRCPSTGGAPNGSDCAAIAGASTSAYVVGSGDLGRRLRVRVTATNADGSTTVASNATKIVARAGALSNTELPAISGSPTVGSTLTASPGSWSVANPSFTYSWRRCDLDGTACAAITDATQRTYLVRQVDQGNTLRVRVVARSEGRSAGATSAATQRITVASPTTGGCPAGTGAMPVADVSSPARLAIDRQQLVPAVVTGTTNSLTLRVHISACSGRPVQGALVYATAVPYNQFSVPPEQQTDVEGWATLTMGRLRGYPATPRQQLLVMFIRARKAGESSLGGISTRRLISFPVRLNG